MSQAIDTNAGTDTTPYNETIVRYFVIATTFWGIVGFLAGVVIALQLTYPALNFDVEWLSFGRLRPVHTSAVIFAFGGNALLATSLYVVQRTCRASLFGGPALANFLFWGYQIFIVLAALGYIFGITQSKEYAEPEWYVDLWLTIVWVVYFVIFTGTIMRRREPHIYVANWFFLAFIITVAILHIVNNLTVPVSVFGAKSYSLFAGVQDALTQWWYGHNAVGFFLTAGFLGIIITVAILHIVNNLTVPVSVFGAKSYSLFAGVQDALTQWWYGHNAVGFFLTAGFLGIMYYFVPKQAERPVYSYRLSVVQRALKYDDISDHLRANRAVGVPYTDDMIANAAADIEAQANADSDAEGLLGRYPKAVVSSFDGNPDQVTQMDAVIAYLQILGRMVDFSGVTAADLEQ